MERETRQKKIIAEIFENTARPLSINELYSLCQEKLPNIGKATVYRSVNRMTEQGTLKELTFPSIGICYEKSDLPKHHSHFVCQTCKKVYELDDVNVSIRPTLPQGFTLKDMNLIISGFCKHCTPKE